MNWSSWTERRNALKLLPRPAAVWLAWRWARDVLPVFEVARPGDDRPRKAVETTREWLEGGAAAAAAADAAAYYAAAAAASYASYAAAAAAAAAADAASDADKQRRQYAIVRDACELPSVPPADDRRALTSWLDFWIDTAGIPEEFLDSIRDGDTPLVLADWLEERGDARAVMLRTACEPTATPLP